MMMTTTKMLQARASAAAIAAVLALSSTSAFAQDAQPAPTDATPSVVTEPAPATTTTTPDPAPVESTTTATPAKTDSSATDATVETTTAKATTARKAARTATKAATSATKAASAATHAAAQSAAVHNAAPAAATAAPVAATPAADTAPVVDMSAPPAQAPAQPTAKPASTNNDAALEMGGGALAILALGAGAFALARRRRHADEEVWEDEYVEPETVAEAEPMMAPAIAPRHDPVATYDPPVRTPDRSAFAWNGTAANEERETNDRQPGETWVERAYRGPTADNPSQSLRKRLKRAAFFDKREREIAANKAAPVEADAGLPERAMEERQLEAA